MSPLVAALIASTALCGPSLDFRTFYASYFYAAAPGTFWAAPQGEDMSSIARRVINAQTDYLEYRIARRETCK